jgi:hypothetical protein
VVQPLQYSPATPVALRQPVLLADGEVFKPHKPFVFDMHFRTSSSDAVLFQAAAPALQADLATLRLTNGSVVLSFDYGCGAARVSTASRVDDGMWHTVSFSRTCNHGMLVVDGGADAATALAYAFDDSSWRSLFSVGSQGKRVSPVISALNSLELVDCAQRCIDEPYCVAFNYLGSFNASSVSVCELLAFTAGPAVDSADMFLYYESLLVAGNLTLGGPSRGPLPALEGCAGGLRLNTWPVDVRQTSGLNLPSCQSN